MIVLRTLLGLLLASGFVAGGLYVIHQLIARYGDEASENLESALILTWYVGAVAVATVVATVMALTV